MVRYTRYQLLVLLGLLSAFGGGLAVDRWRRAHPEVVERLERFDRQEMPHDGAVGHGPRQAASSAPSDRQEVTLAPGPGAGVAGATAPIDVNRATAEELTRLPGIGPALAMRIIEARDDRPFASVEDLRRVRGLGGARLERLRPLLMTAPP